MPWAALAGAQIAATLAASRRYRRTVRYTPGWSDLRVSPAVDDCNNITDFMARGEVVKSMEAWAAYMQKRKADRREYQVKLRGVRMSTRLERRRAAIQAKWKARGKVAAILALAVPGAIIVLSLAWRAAMWAVVS